MALPKDDHDGNHVQFEDRILAFDEATARLFADIGDRMVKSGRQIGIAD
jgi:hypothetical protein